MINIITFHLLHTLNIKHLRIKVSKYDPANDTESIDQGELLIQSDLMHVIGLHSEHECN
jgi:hypothetical protein